MINKILIANRGEIACRIIKTAKAMGIATVAIYSEADIKALHVQMADCAYYVGKAASSESYLNSQKIIEIAKKHHVDAIHPGYGFLSENTGFAQACADNGIIFIGPSVAAIAAMGSKSAAKKIMQEAKIPLVPGYHGDNQDEKFLLQQAREIGFPVLLKAAAGGGGKGMRVVHSETEFADAFMGVKREAKAYFNDDKLLIEAYLAKPRHIEIQIFGDRHGNYVHLFERDCSIQRRHQKIIEEAPAPNLPEKLRQEIAAAAIEAAKAIHYTGAGTVEFLVDAQNQFYFMEMNTRLQVEHPVTEMITGLDLVAWQIAVAEGKALPLSQQQITQKGHALEVRLYAEDPYNQFLPSTGTIQHLRWPEAIRIDTGFQEGDSVSAFYDPMLAKLITWGDDRVQAMHKMQRALQQLQMCGIKSNTPFLLALISQADFINEKFDTGFIETHHEQLLPENHALPALELLADLLANTALFHALQPNKKFQSRIDAFSPWNAKDGWRMNLTSELEIRLKFNNKIYQASIVFHDDYYHISINGTQFDLTLIKLSEQSIETAHAGAIKTTAIVPQKDGYTVFQNGKQYFFELFDPLKASEILSGTQNSMAAPMPGTIVFVGIKDGDKVVAGTKLITMEAMKMEHTIYAPSDGTVKELLFQVGDMVSEGAELLIFKAEL